MDNVVNIFRKKDPEDKDKKEEKQELDMKSVISELESNYRKKKEKINSDRSKRNKNITRKLRK
jgi:molybdopterin converting factor small subunit